METPEIGDCLQTDPYNEFIITKVHYFNENYCTIDATRLNFYPRKVTNEVFYLRNWKLIKNNIKQPIKIKIGELV